MAKARDIVIAGLIIGGLVFMFGLLKPSLPEGNIGNIAISEAEP